MRLNEMKVYKIKNRNTKWTYNLMIIGCCLKLDNQKKIKWRKRKDKSIGCDHISTNAPDPIRTPHVAPPKYFKKKKTYQKSFFF